MSKEQTPIKDLEFYKSNAEEDYMNTPISVLRYITELENNTQAKVLEALEEKSKTAESILETLNDMHSNDEIGYDRYTYLFDKVASIQLNETEVKPKYE